jgi:hypothetical protein
MKVMAAKRIASPTIVGVMTAGCTMVFMIQIPFFCHDSFNERKTPLP